MAHQAQLTGFVALSHEDAKKFEASGQLEPGFFPEFQHYVPLDRSAEYAMETAILRMSSLALDMPVRKTTWYVAKVTFAEGAIADMFQRGLLHWSANMYRLELWAPLEAAWLLRGEGAGGPSMELIEVPVMQVGMDDWGDRVLSAQFWLNKSACPATCEHCGEGPRFLWEAPAGHDGSFCSACWHAYVSARGAQFEEASDSSWRMEDIVVDDVIVQE